MTNANTSGGVFAWDDFKSNTWSAETVGASITGRVVSLEAREGRSGRVPVVTLEDGDGGRRDVWCGAADLRAKVADLEPQVGDVIKITFTGERQTGQVSPMKLFAVERVSQPAVSSYVGDEPF